MRRDGGKAVSFMLNMDQKEETYYKKKKKKGAGEMAQQLKVLAALSS